MVPVACSRLRNVACVVLSLLFSGGAAAYAEPSSGDWSGLSGGIWGLYASVYTLLRVAMGLGMLFALFRAVVKVMQGDREGAVRLVWWFVGFVFGFVMIVVVYNVLLGQGPN